MSWIAFGVSTALAVAAAVANKQSQNKTIERRNDLAAAEAERQKGLQARASAVSEEALSKQAPAKQSQQLAEIVEKRTSALRPSQSDTANLPSSGSAPIEVKGEIARQMSNAIRQGRARLGAQARLGAFNQGQFNNQLNINRGLRDIGQIQNFSQGSQNVFPLELEGAPKAGKGWANAADAFNLASSVVGLYGMTRAPKTMPRQQGMSGLTINQPGGGLYTYP